MAPTIARKRKSRFDIAISYVTNAWKSELAHSFHILKTTSCSSCRRSSHRSFLDKRRKLRKVRAKLLSQQAKMSPAKVPAQSSSAPATPKQQSSFVAPRATSEQPEGAQAERKRKISEVESEPYGRRSRRQSKKPRPEASSDEKPQEQPGKQKPGQQAPSSSGKQKPGQHASSSSKDPPSAPPVPRPSVPSSGLSKAWPSRVGTQKIKGLRNPGNWCYRRSVLQILLAMPQFFNLLEQTHVECHAPKGRCVNCALFNFFNTYHKEGAVGPYLTALDAAIRATSTSIPGWTSNKNTQEDSHEFLQYLLGTVEDTEGVPTEQFDPLFKIAHATSWTCSHCKKKHAKTDPAVAILSLPVPQHETTLRSCLDTYHKEPETTIRCDKCSTNLPRTRALRIAYAPEVLPIQLARFVKTNPHKPAKKNVSYVDYPESLDLSRWSVDTSKPLRYRLDSVVAHSGNLKAGHYIAFVRGPDGVMVASDSDISKSSIASMRKPGGHFTPYILTYVRL